MTTNLRNLANAIYTRAYFNQNDISDTSHHTKKTAEIYEWLCEGEINGATVEELTADWVEFDQESESAE